MESHIIVPDEALPYILFQRTEYLKNSLFFRTLTLIGLVKFLYKPSVSLKCAFFKDEIKKSFSDDMQKEYKTIEQFIPATASAILDIGCGVAGIDVLLSAHYGHAADICLLDKTSIDATVYYGFKNRGSVYNSLAVSIELLEKNNVPVERIHTQEATDDNAIEFSQQFDLVLSLISWGYHYPVSTYLQKVHDKLRPGGTLIIDVRKDTKGEEEVKAVFGNSQVIFTEDTVVRVMAKK